MLQRGTHLAWSCGVLVLLYYINSSFASPTEHVLEKIEVAPRNLSVKLKDIYESFLTFLKPMISGLDVLGLCPYELTSSCLQKHAISAKQRNGCDHLDKQILIPCHVGEVLNITECLTNKCCPSETIHELKCYLPLLDIFQITLQRMQMMFRVLVFGAGGLFILGCLPLCCCAGLRRSHCLNPLRRPNKKLLKIVLKKKAHRDEAYDPLLD